MNQEIGFLMDESDQLSDLFHMKYITIFQNGMQVKKISYPMDISADEMSTLGIRRWLAQLNMRLDSCKILVGTVIIGMPYHILTGYGYVLCEATKWTEKLLEQIMEDYGGEKKINSALEGEKIELCPQAIDEEGNFFFDFGKVQKYYPDISSKKILLPFLSHQLFQTVTIKCGHVMPWLERYVEERGLEIGFKKEDGSYQVVISHKYCKEQV